VADFVTARDGASERERVHPRAGAAARELLPILTATESDLQRSGNVQALARELRLDERVLIAWTQHRQSARTRAQPSLREQRRLAGRSAPLPSRARRRAIGQREGSAGAAAQQPGGLFANRRLRELQGNDAALAPALGRVREDFAGRIIRRSPRGGKLALSGRGALGTYLRAFCRGIVESWDSFTSRRSTD